MWRLENHFFLVFALLLLVARTSAQTVEWQLTSLLSNAESISFTIERGSSPTNCTASWSTRPTIWTQCADTMLRWRFETYGSASNFSMEIVEIDLIKTSTPPSVNVTRASVSLTSSSLSTHLILTTTTSSFAPSPFDIFYTLTRADPTDVIPCTQAYTFYITNPNVATLGPLTLGRGTETQWETSCSTTYSCGSTDSSLSSFQSCQAPAFTFKRTLPPGGNVLSNFVLSVEHEFPLMMATSIRGSDAPDYSLSDAEEAGGLMIVLTLANSTWADGGKLSPIESGGIDQTGDCATGCEFSGVQTWVPVVDVEIV